MRQPSREIVEQVEASYRRMAREARYRPAAPSDGFGNITVPEDELDLDAEARAYAERWWREEEECEVRLGFANWPERPAMIFALEAAWLCCAGGDSPAFALKLARMAVAELESRVETETAAS